MGEKENPKEVSAEKLPKVFNHGFAASITSFVNFLKTELDSVKRELRFWCELSKNSFFIEVKTSDLEKIDKEFDSLLKGN